ncbi:hypothetical protein [Martelella mediterranea]|uniref:Glycosyltransferase n=1 Tax=Martelella mediterranea TaxID=293089 RepID=A0A4R3P0S5_9HYPH|nr:hypothetical protein [Martelella mediterranea]TCT42721.1 hypothetical protein EDC90_100420 [Martelella mediterranea]
MQTVVCMKWGQRYSADYVNRLWSSIKRHTVRETRLVCFTDDPSGVDPAVQCHPLPEIRIPDEIAWSPWRKLSLWQTPLADLSGDVLFLDLDIVITGALDPMFDFAPGKYCACENWTQPGQGIGNTSVFRWNVGANPQIFRDFEADAERIRKKYRIEQVYISAEIDEMLFWPSEWCVSFKHTLMPSWPLNFFKTVKLPENTKVVAFTGKPDPDEAAIGKWPVDAFWKKLYKFVRPTPWIDEYWQ